MLAKKITAERLARTHEAGLMSYSHEVKAPDWGTDLYFWKVGVSVTTTFRGPAAAVQDMTQQASRLIAHELYGEVEEGLYELMKLLCEERYRPSGDPIMMKLSEIMELTRG